jgi:hypothetical protein
MRNFRRLSFSVIILSLSYASIVLAYSGGTGEPNNPYQIASKVDLLALAANTGDYGKCFILTADIDMEGQVFTKAIIAAGNFTGTFDGNSHKISNFTINGGSNSYLGLFGQINYGGSIKNLGLESFAVSGSSGVGGLVGSSNGGSISDCYSTGSVSGSYSVGGLVGENDGSAISNCYSTGSVSGSYSVGGLAGYNAGSISNCYSTGAVTGGENSLYLGGLVGENDGSAISNCYSTGSVSGSYYVGGLVGYSNYGSISNCYSTGGVGGYGSVGGLVGYSNYGSISNCYSKGDVGGSGSVGGLVGGNDNSCSISNCYSTGAVTGEYGSMYLGGLVGYSYGSISNCYSTGAVTGGDGSGYLGGLVGYGYGSISNCYSTGAVTSGDESGFLGGLAGENDGTTSSSYFLITSGPDNGYGTPLTDEQMKQQSSFVDWDFDAVWAICEGTNYPRLVWQIPAADWVCPDGVNFADFAYFADRWLESDCASSNNFCGGADIDLSGSVDMADLAIFAENWLEGI